MCFASGGDGGAGGNRKRQKQREVGIALGTNSINDIFGQFTDSFFERNVGNPFLDFSLPQFNEQKRNGFEDLVYALSNRGLLSSSAGARARNEYNDYADIQFQGLQDQARAKVDEGLSNAEQQRINTIANLNATGDVQGALTAARNQAQLLSRTPAFNPLGAMFQNFTSSFLNNRTAPSTTGGGSSGVTNYNSGVGGGAGSALSVG